MTITFQVIGKAKTAGSKRAFFNKATGRAMLTDSCAKSKDWKTDVQRAAAAAYSGPLLTGALAVSLGFSLSRPKAHYTKTGALRESCKVERPTKRPDLLKLARAVEDACTGILWVDDAQIIVEHLEKWYREDRRDVLEVTVESAAV